MQTSSNSIQNLAIPNDIRACRYYLEHLSFIKRIPSKPYNRNDIHSCQAAIKIMMSDFTKDKSVRDNLLAEMAAGCETNILPMESLNWFMEDKRAAFWLWAKIYTGGDHILSATNTRRPHVDNNESLYKRLRLSDSPCSHQERVALITCLFDSIFFVPFPHKMKRDILEELKKNWKHIYQHPMPLKWLPDEESAVEWAWGSLKSYVNNTTTTYSGMFQPLPSLASWFEPLNHAEKLLAVRTALDLWDNAPDSKRLFLLNLNKAWNQRKLRQQRTDKKALNTYLKNETKAHLDSLAAHYDMRISDVLEMLIKERHRQVKSSS